MIKRLLQNKFRFILSTVALFLISSILRINLAIPLFLLILVVYVVYKYPQINTKPYNLLNASLLIVIIFVLSFFLNKNGISIFYIPFSFIPILSIILFDDLEICLLITIASAISVAGLSPNSFFIVLMFLTSGLTAMVLVKDTRRRMIVIRTGIIIGIIQMVVFLFTNHFRTRGYETYYGILLINAIASSIIAIGISPVFEYLFKTITNISLLELADFNHPLMQRMVIEAPGTYHHSLIVGNLSDAAAKTIGANTLLARVGAYYHDIGKLAKPDYFSENQGPDTSMHDKLSADMSKLIIMNHVKEGVELANKYKLNARIIDFIQQHHGSSLVYYFYRKALENMIEDHDVKEEGFRYPGPKPNTKETAIVLLADSVEAATRALKEPTPVKIEELVHKIINNKFIDGQLDECDLTLKDMEKIASVFIRILSGIYHGRVTYPGQSQFVD